MAYQDEHNMQVLADLTPGDLVEFINDKSSHWAVLIERNQVVHLASAENHGLNCFNVVTFFSTTYTKMFVREDDYWEVAVDSIAQKKNYKDYCYKPFSPEEIVQRAIDNVGKRGYNLWRSSKHFAKFCRYGEARVLKHNKAVLEGLQRGDLVAFGRGRYAHWAVYKGDEEVVHLSGDQNDGLSANLKPGSVCSISGKPVNKASVRIDKFWDVAGSSFAYNSSNHLGHTPFPPDEIVDRAMSKVGVKGYNIIWGNCEHFAMFCRYGMAESQQAWRAARQWGCLPCYRRGERNMNL